MAGKRGSSRRRIVLVAVLLVGIELLAPVPVALAAPPLFSKAFAPDSIGPGSVTTLTFTIDNSAEASPATELAFSDVLPVGVVIASPASAATTCSPSGTSGPTVSATPGGSTISLSDASVAAGTSCTVSVDVTSGTFGTHSNVSGDLTSTAGTSGSAAADLVVATDRPGFSKVFSPTKVDKGKRSTLVFTVDNEVNEAAVTALDFTDTLPAGLVIADPANASTTCGGVAPPIITAVPGSNVVTFDADGFALGGLEVVSPGDVCFVQVDVLAAGSGNLVNRSGNLDAVVGGVTRTSGKASASLAVERADLHIIKEFPNDPVPPGGTAALRFTIENFDRSNPATAVAFTDNLPANVVVATPPAPVNTCGGSLAAGAGASIISLSGGAVPAAGSCTITVNVTPTAAGNHVNTSGFVSGTIDGEVVSGNTASDVLFATAAPILTKEFVGGPVAAGSTVTLRFTIEDTTAMEGSTDIAFVDELTAGADDIGPPSGGFLPFPVSVTLPPAPDPPCGDGSSLSLVSLGTDRQGLQLEGGNLAAGARCDFTVSLTLPASLANGTYTNTTRAITATVGGSTVVGMPASDDLVVVAAPTLSKQFLDDPVVPGATVDLQFTLSHDVDAVGNATAIAFTDDLDVTLNGLTASGLPLTAACDPDGPGGVAGTGTLSASAGNTLLSFTGGTLAPGQSCSFTVTLQVPAGAAPGAKPNTTSTVSAQVAGEAVAGQAASDNLDISGVVLTKSFTNDPVVAGGAVVLRFVLTNNSPTQAASNLAFTDDLNAVLPGLEATGLPKNDVCGAGSQLSGTSTISFTGGLLAPGATCFFTATLLVPADAESGTYNNRTGALTGDPAAVITPDAAKDALVIIDPLSLTKSFTNDPAGAGATVNLRFVLENRSTTSTAANLAFTDDLDAVLPGLVALGLPRGDVCGIGSQLSGTSTISLTGGSLPPATSCVFGVTVRIPAAAAGGAHPNTTSQVTGSVGGAATTAVPASDALVVVRSADLAVTKVDSVDPVVAGGNLAYTVTVSNNGPSDALGVRVADTLPAGVTLVSTAGCAEDPGGVPTCTLGTIAAGTSEAFTATVAVGSGVAAGTILGNTATVSSATALVNTGDDSAAQATTVRTEADLAVTKVDSADPVVAGGNLTYTVTVSNNGPSDALGVRVADTLPAGVTLVATSGCAEDPAGVPTCTLGTIAAGASKSFTATVRVDGAARSMVNRATATSATTDLVAANNSASQSTAVVVPAAVVPTGSIGDFVWFDDDGDGVHDPGEPGLGGIRVSLVSAVAGTQAQATTDAGGRYLFSGVEAGSYQVRVEAASAPADLVLTTVDTYAVSLAPGQDFLDADFGFAPLPAPTVGLVDPAKGIWYLRNSAGAVTPFTYGNPGDVPFMGDWDCDGTDTPGLFRTSDAFAYLRNSNTQGIADIRFFFGDPSDVPLAGDWNGDGCDTLSIYRPSEQRFYIINRLGENEGGLGAADFFFDFGNPGDKAVVGDWDADGSDEVGLHRESTGFFYWRNTLDTGIASGEIFFGDPADRFVAGDWGIVDGRDTPAVFRPANAVFFFRHTLTEGIADSQFPYGEPPWLPVAGKFGLG